MIDDSMLLFLDAQSVKVQVVNSIYRTAARGWMMEYSSVGPHNKVFLGQRVLRLECATSHNVAHSLVLYGGDIRCGCHQAHARYVDGAQGAKRGKVSIGCICFITELSEHIVPHGTTFTLSDF